MPSKSKEGRGSQATFKMHSSAGPDQTFTPEELIAHIDFVRQLTQAISPDDLAKRLLKVLDHFGFSDFIFLRQVPGQPPDFFFTSAPRELVDQYLGQHLYRQDMALDYLQTDNPNHFYQSDIQQIIEDGRLLTHTFEKHLEIIALFNKFEFNNAYLMPYRANEETGSESVLFFLMAKGVPAKKLIALAKPHGAALHLLGDTTIRVYQHKFKSHKPTLRINPKPLRLLTIMAKSDLNLRQAADKLCISTDTANKYMAMAKKMFGSRSQANAVYRAIQEGLIDFS